MDFMDTMDIMDIMDKMGWEIFHHHSTNKVRHGRRRAQRGLRGNGRRCFLIICNFVIMFYVATNYAMIAYRYNLIDRFGIETGC